MSVYKISNLDEETFINTSKALKGYYKFLSILYLDLLGLPKLDGIIITKWEKDTEENIKSFFKKKSIQKVMIRSDKKNETGKLPRGGYLVDINNMKEEALKLFKNNRIIALLEPANFYDNLYGFNALFHPDVNYIHMEVVGPGFDVSDIKRGDISPHEIIKLPRVNHNQSFDGAEELSPWKVKRTIMSPGHYQKAVFYRLVKIGRLITKQKNLQQSLDEDNLIELAIDYLQKSNHTLLLNNMNKYNPMSFRYIENIYYYIVLLPEKMKLFSFKSEPFVISGGIVKPNRVVFWDIVWPDLKYVPPKKSGG